MLKRLLCLLLLLALVAALEGCAQESAPQALPAPPPGATEAPAPPGAAPSAEESLTLARIKQAALEAGYIVSDGHQYILMEDILEGITIEIMADGAHTLYSVAECGTEEAAARNAAYIDSRGYAVSLRNGRFFSSYDAGNPGQTRKELLTAILAGTPLPAPAYPGAAQAESELEETPESATGRQEGTGYLAEGDMLVTIHGLERQTLDGKSGVIITYELTNASNDMMDTTSALYVKVEQDYVRLSNPSTYEPAYYVIDWLKPGESLMFYDEYILDKEKGSILIEIEEYGSFIFTDPPIVYRQFTLDG